MMERSEMAVQLFDKGFNCSQAVFSVFCEELGLDSETARKIACGFGGGMRKGEVCGAVTGALMTLGLKYGQGKEEDREAKQATYRFVTEFNRKFAEANKTIICKELLGYDLSKEDEYRQAQEKGLFRSICPKMIRDAVIILEKEFFLMEAKG